MERNEIVKIKVNQIYLHPDNPRKDVGDVTELAESIKKNGIMQNLTVIPISALSEEPEKQPDANEISLLSDFHVLIGHRRLTAAKAAGLEEVPCKIISKISKKEQVSIMLEENMQRNDLTIYEQAQGFQMMLDLGETEDSLAEKTGFSRTTIHRRLNIAKLDQKLLKEKEQDKTFQLSLNDLYVLERVKDVKTRNKILKESRDSRELAWKVQSAVKETERKEKEKAIIALLKPLGVQQAPENASREMYSGKWETVKEIDLNKDVPKQIRLKKTDEQMYYFVQWNAVRIIKKAKKEKKEITPEEQRRKQIDRNKKEIKSAMKQMDNYRKLFIQNILLGEIKPLKDSEQIKDEVWSVLITSRTYLDKTVLNSFFTEKAEWDCTQEEKEDAQKQVESLNILHQMLVAMNYAMDNIGEICDWQGYYKEDIGQKLQKGYSILEKYGFSFEDDEGQQLLDGTHELYLKKGE